MEPIPSPKLRALREALERDGEVVFKNGSKVVRQVVTLRAVGEEEASPKVILLVVRPAGGMATYDDGDSGLRRAYAMALDGPTPKPQPSGDPAMFGDDPPW